jgi:DNA-binding transcriptional ArsR family regulator
MTLARESSDLADDLVWRALADPTRREILDLLRERPLTTGEIADHFEQTRFGVMKHLNVLVDAELVVVIRDGRKRWNHLNPMPLLEIYRRWIRHFEEPAMSRLDRLRRHAERSAEEAK